MLRVLQSICFLAIAIFVTGTAFLSSAEAAGTKSANFGSPMPTIEWNVTGEPYCTAGTTYNYSGNADGVRSFWRSLTPSGSGSSDFGGRAIGAPAGTYTFSCTAGSASDTTTLVVCNNTTHRSDGGSGCSPIASYNITFDRNGGSGSMGFQTIQSGNTVSLNPNTFTRSGYSFDGWANSAGGSVVYSDGGGYTMGSSNVTLYAKWSVAVGASCTWTAGNVTWGNGTWLGDCLAFVGGTTISDGASFGPITNTASGYAGSVSYTCNNGTFSAPINPICTTTGGGPYTVTYNGNSNTGGSAPADQSKIENTTLTLRTNTGNLTRTNYTFSGWNTAANGGGTDYAVGGSYVANAPVTLYAKWLPAQPSAPTVDLAGTACGGQIRTSWTPIGGFTYNLQYRQTGSSGGWTSVGSNQTSPTVVTVPLPSTSYDFQLQAVNTAGNSSWSGYGTLTSSAACGGGPYTVTYNGNSNTGGSAPADQSKIENTTLTLRTNTGNLTRTNYTFSGWNTAANGGGTDYAVGGSYVANAPVTLYAKWVAAGGASCTWPGGNAIWSGGLCSAWVAGTTISDGATFGPITNTASGYTGSASYTCNNGTFSGAVNPICNPVSGPPAQPVAPTINNPAAPCGGNINVTWWDDPAATDGYDLQYKRNSDPNIPASWTTRSFVSAPYLLNGLDFGVLYNIQIKANNSTSGDSTWSPYGNGNASASCAGPTMTDAGFLPDNPADPIPGNGRVANGAQYTTFWHSSIADRVAINCIGPSWSFNDNIAANNNDGSIAMADMLGTAGGTINCTFIPYSGVTPGAPVLRMLIIDPAVVGPATPLGFSAMPVACGGSIDASWMGVTGATSYSISYDGGTNYINIGDTTSIRLGPTGLSPSTSYDLRLKAHAAGPSESAPASFNGVLSSDACVVPIPGVCGTAWRPYTFAETSYTGLPASLCDVGTPSSNNPDFPVAGGTESWSCSGVNGGGPASCMVTRTNFPAPEFFVTPCFIQENDNTCDARVTWDMQAGTPAYSITNDTTSDSISVASTSDNLPNTYIEVQYGANTVAARDNGSIQISHNLDIDCAPDLFYHTGLNVCKAKPDLSISLPASDNVWIRSGSNHNVTYTVSASYPVKCTHSGGNPSTNEELGIINSNPINFTVGPLRSAQLVRVTCEADIIPAIPASSVFREKRINVLPVVEEI